jgi:hypothetical protein
MHTQPRPEPPVPIAPIHRRSWRTLWRRCSCGLSEPCVDRLTTARPLPDPCCGAESAADRTAGTVPGIADSPESPLTDPHGGEPPQGNEPRGRLYLTPAPRQRPPVEDVPPALDGSAAAVQRPAAAHPPASPPVRFRTTGKQPGFPRRSDTDLSRSPGSSGRPLGPTGRPIRTHDAELGRAGLLTPGQASRSTSDVVREIRSNGTVS